MYLFVNKFSALFLCKINFFDILDMGDIFQVFVISRTTEILIESNFMLAMYVPFILKFYDDYLNKIKIIVEVNKKRWIK